MVLGVLRNVLSGLRNVLGRMGFTWSIGSMGCIGGGDRTFASGRIGMLDFNFKKCNLTLAMSPTCPSKDALII